MQRPSHSSLGAELAREQDRIYGDKSLSELDLVRGMGHARHRATRRYRRIAFGFVGLFVATTTSIALVAFRFPVVEFMVVGESPAKETGGEAFGRWVVAPAQQPKVVSFSDGSIAKLSSEARIRIIGTTRRGASMTLESGSAELRVAGSRLTEYQLGVGPFSLTMTKGRTEVSWDPMNEMLDLIVHEGYVVIAGCQFGPGRSVLAGKELGTRCISR